MGKWMRNAAVAAFGWAMLAGTAQATVITYYFSAPVRSYDASSGDRTPTGVFAGSVSFDTAKFAQGDVGSDDNPEVGYTHIISANGPVLATATSAVSGTPMDALANSPLAHPATAYHSDVFLGTGSNFGGLFTLSFTETFSEVINHPDDSFTINFDHRIFEIAFAGATAMLVDGYALPTPGSGHIDARLSRVRGYNTYSAGYGEFLGGGLASVAVAIYDAQTTAGEGPADVPEPGALALLGLGVVGVAVRRRSAKA